MIINTMSYINIKPNYILFSISEEESSSKSLSNSKLSFKNNNGDLANTICPFHQFMKNNIFTSSNELDEMPNKDVYDYLNDF